MTRFTNLVLALFLVCLSANQAFSQCDTCGRSVFSERYRNWICLPGSDDCKQYYIQDYATDKEYDFWAWAGCEGKSVVIGDDQGTIAAYYDFGYGHDFKWVKGLSKKEMRSPLPLNQIRKDLIPKKYPKPNHQYGHLPRYDLLYGNGDLLTVWLESNSDYVSVFVSAGPFATLYKSNGSVDVEWERRSEKAHQKLNLPFSEWYELAQTAKPAKSKFANK